MTEQRKFLNEEAKILKAIESSDGITETEISDSTAVEIQDIRTKLEIMKSSGASIESRKVGKTVMWYPIVSKQVNRILIVEDDENINDLEKASIGEGYDIKQVMDGTAGLKMAREWKPDLIILDLMLPGIGGLDICQTLKRDPATKDIIVIIVSATDATRNRFKGIKFGADYYIRKPFRPKELRSLTKIFLKKRGRRFDPLVDLPDEKRISRELEDLVAGDIGFEVNNLRIINLENYANEYGHDDAKLVIRLVSQILQDKVQEWDSENGFVGYIGNGEFIIGGGKNETELLVSEVATEFENVLAFIYQDKKIIDLDLDGMFESGGPGNKLFMKYDIIPSQKIIETRKHLLEKKDEQKTPSTPGMYTYEQLRELVGSDNLDVAITRDANGTKLAVSKAKEE
ncbi:MAG: response regulator [Candidatus Micrarchaeota archaeon]